jgi:PadR family transcriptional regulator, regulatory protein PadR
MEERIDLPQGTLDLLILKTLALEPLHGWAVSARLQQISGEAVQVQQGSLYPALHRLERRGWIKAEWNTTENNRRARYYSLTRAGRKQLETGEAAWRRLSTVVGQVLDLA